MTEPEGPRGPEVAQKRGGMWSTIAAVGAFVLLKAKAALGILKLASFGKFALTGLSMVLMMWFEAQRYGLAFGVGFVLLILVHELGHGYAIKRAGLDAGWPVFIPFFGAMISLRGRVPSASVNADIAYAGPVWGTAASLACAAVYFLTGARMFLALAYTGFFLNLFNMIPMPPLDGGRVAMAFSRKAWILGGVMIAAMFFATRAPQLLLIGGLALMHVFRRQAPDDHVELDEATRRAWTFRYFGLCFFLGAAIYCAQQLLHGAEV